MGEEITFTSLPLNEILIGSGEAYSVNNSQYIEEILFFDRRLTIDELKAISIL